MSDDDRRIFNPDPVTAQHMQRIGSVRSTPTLPQMTHSVSPAPSSNVEMSISPLQRQAGADRSVAHSGHTASRESFANSLSLGNAYATPTRDTTVAPPLRLPVDLNACSEEDLFKM